MKVKVMKGEDTLRTFDAASEAKKLEKRYAQVESNMLKARVVAVKDNNYVEQLHAKNNTKVDDGIPKLKVSLVSKTTKNEDVSEFDTDSKFIPRDSSEEHDENEVVVEKAPLVAGASDPTAATGDMSDGEIDHGEFDDDEPVETFDQAITSAIYEAIEEGKDDIIDAVDDLPEQTEDDDVLRVAGSPGEEDGRSEEDKVLIAGASQTESDPEEEEDAETDGINVNDSTAITEDGEVVEVVVEEPDAEMYDEYDEEIHKKTRKKSARFDPSFYT